MPTRQTASAQSPQFLRVDKHLSKYTKSLNQHLERPIQWGEAGKSHTRGLVLVDEAKPAAEVSVPNRVAQDHVDRDPQIAPGSAASALAGWWISTLDTTAVASEEPDAGSEADDVRAYDGGVRPPDGAAPLESGRHSREHTRGSLVSGSA